MATADDMDLDNRCDFCGEGLPFDDAEGRLKLNNRKFKKNVHQFNRYSDFVLCSTECISYFTNWYFGYDLSQGLPYYVQYKSEDYAELFFQVHELRTNPVKGWENSCYNCNSKNDTLVFLPVDCCFYNCKKYIRIVGRSDDCMYFCKNDHCLSNFMLFFDRGLDDGDLYLETEHLIKPYVLPIVLSEVPDLWLDCLDECWL